MKIIIKNENSKIKTDDLDLAKLILLHLSAKKDVSTETLVKNGVIAGLKMGSIISKLNSERESEQDEDKVDQNIPASKKLIDGITRKKIRKTPVGKIRRSRWTKEEVEFIIANKDKSAKKLSKNLLRHSQKSIMNVLCSVRNGKMNKFSKKVKASLNK
jgi:vacuolar-type H+-ATPase subunit I/STV1